MTYENETYALREAVYAVGDMAAYDRLDLVAKRAGTTGLLARLRAEREKGWPPESEPNSGRQN